MLKYQFLPPYAFEYILLNYYEGKNKRSKKVRQGDLK